MRPSDVIDRLRDQGYEVRISHRRPATWQTPTAEKLFTKREAKEHGHPLAPKGGVTTVEIAMKNDAAGTLESWDGQSRCSARDNFNRHLGLQIALGRAMKQMQTKNQLFNPPPMVH